MNQWILMILSKIVFWRTTLNRPSCIHSTFFKMGLKRTRSTENSFHLCWVWSLVAGGQLQCPPPHHPHTVQEKIMPFVQGQRACRTNKEHLRSSDLSVCSEWVPVICLWLSVRGHESPCEAADGDVSTADVLMVSINHSWKTESASSSTTFSLADVRPPH